MLIEKMKKNIFNIHVPFLKSANNLDDLRKNLYELQSKDLPDEIKLFYMNLIEYLIYRSKKGKKVEKVDNSKLLCISMVENEEVEEEKLSVYISNIIDNVLSEYNNSSSDTYLRIYLGGRPNGDINVKREITPFGFLDIYIPRRNQDNKSREKKIKMNLSLTHAYFDDNQQKIDKIVLGLLLNLYWDRELQVSELESNDDIEKLRTKIKEEIELYCSLFSFCDYEYIYFDINSRVDNFDDFESNIMDFSKLLTYKILNNKIISNDYDDILENLRANLKITDTGEKTIKTSVDFLNIDFLNGNRHKGMTQSDFPVSHSQRQVLYKINQSNIIPVSGPPGTGKTTLLQSIVSDLYVDHCLKGLEAPRIVGSSTSNKAVTNIIDSMSNIFDSDSLLFKRWINIDSEKSRQSFSYYNCSSQKVSEAQGNNYNYQSNSESNIFEPFKDEIKKTNENLFIENSNHIFKKKYTLNEMKEEIRKVIRNLLMLQEDLSLFFRYDYDAIKDQYNAIYTDIDFLDKYNRNIGFFEKIKMFFSKKSRCIKLNLLINYNQSYAQYNFPEYKYSDMMTTLLKLQNELRDKVNELEKIKNKIQTTFDEINHVMIIENIEEIRNKFSQLKVGYMVDKQRASEKVEESLDITFKKLIFWLSVHYYEIEYLLEEDSEDPNINNLYFLEVKTVSMLHNNIKEKIDLLILDEAGMIPPMDIFPALAFQNRIIAVGDEQQIPPVIELIFSDQYDSNNSDLLVIEEPLSRLIGIEEENYIRFRNMKMFNVPFDCDGEVISPSILGLFLSTSVFQYEKYYNEPLQIDECITGFMLTEHRRCYDELIDYCNRLCYQGLLDPMKGSYKQDVNFPDELRQDSIIKKFYVEGEVENHLGGGKSNPQEAMFIASTIYEEMDTIKKFGSPGETLSDIVGIITPFRHQEQEIRKALQEVSKKQGCAEMSNIEVGTVHKFQGAEKNLIIYSTTYDCMDGNWSFIVKNKNLMNVAVSRSKMSIWVFGSEKMEQFSMLSNLK